MNKLFKLFFWISNITLLLILCVGFFPTMGRALISDWINGRVPLDLMMPLLGLVGVPLTTAVVRLKQQQPKLKPSLSLFELFYSIEAPILAVCGIRLFILRDLTPPSGFLLCSAILGCVGSCYWFWQQRQAESTEEQRDNLISLAGLSLLLLVSLYLVSIASFFIAPFFFSLATGMWSIASFGFVLTLLLFPLFVCACMMSTLPFGMLFVAQKLWWQNLQRASVMVTG